MEHIKDILDQIQIWHLCIGAYIIGVIWMVWEAKNAPLMPDEQPLPPSFRSEHEKKWATPPEEKDKPKDKTWYGPNDRMRDLVHDKEKFEDEYENQPFGD